MTTNVPQKGDLREKTMEMLKKETEKEAWIALNQYFHGAGNGAAAKVACVVVGTLAKEEQAKNNRRQLDLIAKRVELSNKDSRQLTG
jgi:hypothetical protein